jgi:hypothetical protein
MYLLSGLACNVGGTFILVEASLGMTPADLKITLVGLLDVSKIPLPSVLTIVGGLALK